MHLLAEYADSNHSENISKKEFKQAFKIIDKDNILEDVVMQKLYTVLYENRLGLQRAFRLMDSDSSGTLDLQEFITGVQALNEALGSPLTQTQIKQLFYAIDKDKKGYVDYEDFLRQFQIIDRTEPEVQRKPRSRPHKTLTRGKASFFGIIFHYHFFRFEKI